MSMEKKNELTIVHDKNTYIYTTQAVNTALVT